MEISARSVPLCSVIIPAYNCETTISDTIESVLSQSESDWELIAVNDGSTDTTLSILQEYAAKDSRIRVLENPKNSGVAYTRNHGVENARGSYIAFLDSDDRWLPHKLKKQITFMRNTCCHISCTAYHRTDSTGKKILKTMTPPEKMDWKSLCRKNDVGLSTSIVEASLARTVSFRENELLEDFLYWLDLTENGQEISCFPEPLAYYRTAEHSRSGNKAKMALARWKALRKYAHLPLYKAIPYFCYYAFKSVFG